MSGVVSAVVEGKWLQHHPRVCTINFLEIMFGTRAYIEITSCVPFFKSYKPVTEVVSVKLQQKRGTQDVISVHIQKDDVISDNFYVGHMP